VFLLIGADCVLGIVGSWLGQHLWLFLQLLIES